MHPRAAGSLPRLQSLWVCHALTTEGCCPLTLSLSESADSSDALLNHTALDSLSQE